MALFIIAVALTGFAETMGTMLDNATTARNRTYASWIAQNKIVEMRSAGVEPEIGVTSGEVVYASVEWTWEATVSETGIEGLWRLDVSVGLPGANEDIRNVTGFIGEASIPGASNRAWAGNNRSRSGNNGNDGITE